MKQYLFQADYSWLNCEYFSFSYGGLSIDVEPTLSYYLLIVS